MTAVEPVIDPTKAPTGDQTMHIVHFMCPGMTDLKTGEATALCGAQTRWMSEDALKCPVCMELPSKPVKCPMCGEMIASHG